MALALLTGTWAMNSAGAVNRNLQIPTVSAAGVLVNATLDGVKLRGLYDKVTQRITFQIISGAAGQTTDIFAGYVSLLDKTNVAGGQIVTGYRHSVNGTAQLMQFPWTAML